MGIAQQMWQKNFIKGTKIEAVRAQCCSLSWRRHVISALDAAIALLQLSAKIRVQY
jgi:hypothetical protein